MIGGKHIFEKLQLHRNLILYISPHKQSFVKILKGILSFELQIQVVIILLFATHLELVNFRK